MLLLRLPNVYFSIIILEFLLDHNYFVLKINKIILFIYLSSILIIYIIIYIIIIIFIINYIIILLLIILLFILFLY